MEEKAASAGSTRRTIILTLVVAMIAVAGLAIVALRDVLMLLFAGIVLATALQPFCDFLAARLKVRASLAAALVYVSATLLFVGLAIVLLPRMWGQTAALLDQMPAIYTQGRDWLNDSSSRMLRRVG